MNSREKTNPIEDIIYPFTDSYIKAERMIGDLDLVKDKLDINDMDVFLYYSRCIVRKRTLITCGEFEWMQEMIKKYEKKIAKRKEDNKVYQSIADNYNKESGNAT